MASLSTHLLHPSASQGVTPVHRLGLGFFWVAPLHSAGPASSCQTQFCAMCAVRNCGACDVQVAASACELVMPYYYSKILCSISKPGFQEVFKQNLVWYAAFAFGFAVFAAGRGALFGIINNKLSRALR